MHHHSHSPQSGGENGTSNDFNGGRILPVPIEFRRRVLMKPAPKMEHLVQLANASSPMTKLLMEEEKRAPPRLVPWVEVYPIKLNYKVVSHDSGTDNSKATGFVLASRRSRVFDVLQSLLKVAAPQTSTTCRRLWTKRDNLGTKNRGDGYELVDLYGLDGAFIRKDESGIPAKPQLCVGDWIKTFGDAEIVKDIDVVVEIRRSNDSWPRESLEFENRLQVGDFCDAQDSAGKWYEALVREITEDTVKVHYFGWAQKWDATIRRRLDSTIEGPSAVSPNIFRSQSMTDLVNEIVYLTSVFVTAENAPTSSSLDSLQSMESKYYGRAISRSKRYVIRSRSSKVVQGCCAESRN